MIYFKSSIVNPHWLISFVLAHVLVLVVLAQVPIVVQFVTLKCCVVHLSFYEMVIRFLWCLYIVCWL